MCFLILLRLNKKENQICLKKMYIFKMELKTKFDVLSRDPTSIADVEK